MNDPMKAENGRVPGAKGDDPAVHVIRGSRFVCTASAEAKCRTYPACECEDWDPDLHGDPPAAGHENVPQEHCWIKPWLDATDLTDCYGGDDLTWLTDADVTFPDGPITTEWHGDYLTWEYADDSEPVINRDAGEDDA